MRRKEVSNDMIGVNSLLSTRQSMEDHIQGFQHFLKCQNSNQCHNMSEIIIIITIIVLIRSVIATIMNIIIFIIIVTILPSMTIPVVAGDDGDVPDDDGDVFWQVFEYTQFSTNMR